MLSVLKMTTPRPGLRCRQLRYLERYERRDRKLCAPLAGDLPLQGAVKPRHDRSAICHLEQTPDGDVRDVLPLRGGKFSYPIDLS